MSVEALMGEDVIFLTAKENDRYVGCGAVRMVTGQYGEVKRMYVLPSERGKGIASRATFHLPVMRVFRAWQDPRDLEAWD